MNNKKYFNKIIILIFLLPVISTSIFNCFKPKEQKIVSVIVDSIDEKYFSDSRIRDREEKKDIDKKENLSVLSFEKKKDNTIRLVFSHPLLFDEEVGIVFSKLFFYFSPGIKGKFVTRTNRVVDFIIDEEEVKECLLIIPENLYGIKGNILSNGIKIKVALNNSQNDAIYFDAEKGSKVKKINIISLLKNLSADNFTRYFNPSIVNVISEIDLEKIRENNFTFSGKSDIKRFYKKVEKNDISNIIKNIDNPAEIKKYFLSRELNPLSGINDQEPDNNSISYIPPAKKGLYFCYQEIKDDKNQKRNFFQLYNFLNDPFFAFDTEQRILIIDKASDKNGNNGKINVYSASGNLIDEFKINNDGFYTIKNDGYREIFIYKESNYNSLIRVTLNKIEKTTYNILSIIDDNDPRNIMMNGMIVNNGGNVIENYKTLKLNFKIVNNNNKILLNDEIKNIENDGSFKYVFKKNVLTESSLFINYYVNDELLKKFVLKSPDYDSEFFSDPDKAASKVIIQPKEDTVFDDAPCYFVVNDNYLNLIDSIFVNIKGENNENVELVPLDKITEYFKIDLPGSKGIYDLNFEIFLKDGTSIVNKIKINKIKIKKIEEADNERIIVNNFDNIKKESYSFSYEVFNPFNSNEEMLILFDNDIRYCKKINLNNGFNKVSIESKYVSNPDMKALVVLSNYNNDQVYNLKNNLRMEDNINNLNVSVKENESKEEYILKTALDKSKYLNDKLYIQFMPINNNANKSFNDFTNTNNSYENMYFGKVVKIDEKFSNKVACRKYKNSSYNINLYLKNKYGEIIRADKNIKNKKDFEIKIDGPDRIDPLDNPEYKVSMKNNDSKDFIIDSLITANNETIFNKQKIIINGNDQIEIPINLKNTSHAEFINLVVEISSQKRIIDKIEKKINVEKDLIKQSIEISGSIYDKNNTSADFQLPESEGNNFNISIIVSRDASINILKSNPILDNYSYNSFESDFFKYLNVYTENYFLTKERDAKNIEKYYIKDQGFKKNAFNKKINLDSTLLVLFSALQIPELNVNFNIDNILNYILTNYKAQILNSPFRLFVLAEYGVLFNDITKEFLPAIENTNESVLLYKYYGNNNLNYNVRNNGEKSFDVYYDTYKFSSAFYLLIKKYYGLENDIGDKESYLFYQYPIESIFDKLVLLKENGGVKSQDTVKGQVVFKSKKLGDFQFDLMDKDIYLRKYAISFFDSANNERVVDYKIEKDFDGSLNYLIKADYLTDQTFIDNENISIYSEWSDTDGNIINKNDIILNKNNHYNIKLFIISKNSLKNIILKPMSSSAFNIDYESILSDDAKIFSVDDKEKYIIIPELKRGLNVVAFTVFPEYSGIYKVSGNTVIQPYDSGNFIHEKDTYITVINN